MMDRTYGPGSNFGRRDFLEIGSALATGMIAGCGDRKSRNAGNEQVGNTVPPTESREESAREDLGGFVEDISSLYKRLSALPIVKGAKFVFRVKDFENDFDQKQLFIDADSILKGLERRRSPGRDSPRIEPLIACTKLAKLLVRQRGIVHQLIAAGLVYHRRINQSEYDAAANAIQDAQQFVEALKGNVNRILDTVEGADWSRISIEEFDLGAIRTSQTHLVEICRWTKFAYEGLDKVVQGFRKFEAGNVELEGEDYTDAAFTYEKSDAYFESAVEAFDEAQGRGKQLPPIVPVIQGMRCLLPAYIESSSNLSRSMEEFEAGNRDKAREIAREALINADKKASRCF